MFANLFLKNLKWPVRLLKYRNVTQVASYALTNEDKQRFDNAFSQLVTCLTSNNDVRLKPVMDHCKYALEYNVPHGKKARGLLTVAAYKLLSRNISEKHLFQASIMGWCVELLQAFFVVSDDISDNSLTRRGQPCWYRKEDVGLQFAAVDILLLENVIYQLLRTYFREEKYYTSVMELFHEMSMTTIFGQILDIHFAKRTANANDFNEDNYDTICKYKTSLYTFYLPVAIAMNMADVQDTELYNISKETLLKIGKLFQMQDDYLDCFGNPEETGKIGTDIQEGKCSWLIVNALKLMNENETRKLLSCYGKEDKSMVKFVVDKYEELGLKQLYSEREKEIYDSIVTAVNKLPESIPSSLFHYILSITYKRKK